MRRIKNISIPQPCNESWQQMSLAEKGRYCDVCAKTIMDFSLMSHDEIIGYLATNKNVCASVSEQQIKAINRRLLNTNLFTLNRLKRLGVAFSFLSLISYFKASAQVKPTIVKIDTPTQHNGQTKPVILAEKEGIITITGIVTDTLNHPVPGTSITALPSKERTSTANDGSFSLSADAKAFTINSIGFYPQVIIIERKKTEKYTIKLHEEPHVMGQVSIKGDDYPNKSDSKIKLYNKLVDSLSRKKPK